MSEQWRDVSEHCAFMPDSTAGEFAIEDDGKEVFFGYRIRKIELWRAAGDIENGDLSDPDYKPQHAFIVEKRQP